MKRCIICKRKVDGRYDYCKRCFDAKIHELQLKYGENEEGPSRRVKDLGEAPDRDPDKESPAFSYLS
jgi:hypothetical protein